MGTSAARQLPGLSRSPVAVAARQLPGLYRSPAAIAARLMATRRTGDPRGDRGQKPIQMSAAQSAALSRADCAESSSAAS